MKRRIGVHTSIAGGLHKGLEKAHELGCSTLQIFSHNPRGWALSRRDADDVVLFRKLRKEYDISPVFIHTSYLINLASGSRELLRRSVDMVTAEMDIADSIGAEYVVLHTGSASGDDPGSARRRAAAALTEVAQRGQWSAGLLLENTAGERGDITSRIVEISEIMSAVPGSIISGICIDTCHAFSAGYDIRTAEGVRLLTEDVITHIGIDKVRLIHLNDAKGRLGSGLDRHEHLGDGSIGSKGLMNFINHPDLINVPIILETPKKTEEDDPRNLTTARGLLKNSFMQ